MPSCLLLAAITFGSRMLRASVVHSKVISHVDLPRRFPGDIAPMAGLATSTKPRNLSGVEEMMELRDCLVAANAVLQAADEEAEALRAQLEDDDG